MSEVIYHMCPAEIWAAAVAAGSYDGTGDDRRDGALFLHLHGPLSPDKALGVVPLPLGSDGEHVFPPLRD